MKHTHPNGRFSIKNERDSIVRGITADLEHPVGQHIDWWKFDSITTDVDNIYDVGSVSSGRRWKNPVRMPVIMAAIYQGVMMENERGFYNTDVLRVTINIRDLEKLFPNIAIEPDSFLRDRIVYRNEVFIPTRFYPRGLILDDYTVLTLDANQVNPEELVNDRQFAQYAS
jgi:hypothetical protein